MGFEDIAKNMAKREPWLSSSTYSRIVIALVGLALIGLGVLVNGWSRAHADSTGGYWVSYGPIGLGVMMLFASVTGIRRRH